MEKSSMGCCKKLRQPPSLPSLFFTFHRPQSLQILNTVSIWSLTFNGKFKVS